MKKKKIYFLILAIALFLSPLYTQNMSVVISDLRGPLALEKGDGDNIWLTETGTGNNDGRVSFFTPSGDVTIFIEGLPSFFDTATMEVQGVYRARPISDGKLAVFIGESPDPDYGESILIFDRSDFEEAGAPLTAADARSIINIGEYVEGQGFDHSNIYTIVHDGCDMYIVDAAANSIIKRDGLTGELSVFATFAPFPNPLPFGPPIVDPVPTRIIQSDSGFYVSQLTGFPFITGAAKVYHVNWESEITVVDSNLTLITDMRHAPNGGLLTLQYALFGQEGFVPQSAQITRLNADGTRDTIASGFGPSAGMVVDDNGNVYVTSLFSGEVLFLETMLTSRREVSVKQEEDIKVYPNPAYEKILVEFHLPKSSSVTVEIHDVQGRQVRKFSTGKLNHGIQLVEINDIKKLIPGIYVLHVQGENIDLKSKFMIK